MPGSLKEKAKGKKKYSYTFDVDGKKYSHDFDSPPSPETKLRFKTMIRRDLVLKKEK